MKTIWILGAGASISHSKSIQDGITFPNISSIFSTAKEIGIIAQTTKTIKEDYKEVYEYILKYFGKSILDKNETINIEEVLTHLEINIEKTKSDSLRNIRSKIVLMIKNVFDYLSKHTVNNGEYNKLKNKIKTNDSIISFNWDLLFDNTINRIELLSNEDSWDTTNIVQYKNMLLHLSGLGENSHKHIGINQPYTSYSNKEGGYYLKMHGSIDWTYCQNPTCRAYSKVFPVLNHMATHYCSECHETVYPLLILPVLNKQYDTYPFIKRIWNTAAKEISIVEQVIIWGYSLPPTDFYSNWLLRQVNNEIKNIDIINPECVIKSIKSDQVRVNRNFTNKYINIFKNKLKRNNIRFYEFFNDFIQGNNNSIEIKYKSYGIKL